jgi:integrase
VRLMAETGLRASETVSLTVADVQPVKNGVVTGPARQGHDGSGRATEPDPYVL